MFCCHKWGKIENKYQYCTKCNQARPVKCNHNWEEKEAMKLLGVNSKAWKHTQYIMKCTECGEMTSRTY